VIDFRYHDAEAVTCGNGCDLRKRPMVSDGEG
jgi:hypothetical protein